MSSMKQCQEALAHYIKARIPLIVIQSSELGRSVELIKSVIKELKTPNAFLHSEIYGTINLSTEKKVDDDRTIFGAVSFITTQIEKKQRSLFIFTNPGNLSAESELTRPIQSVIELAGASGNTIIIISPDNIWSRLLRNGMRITLDFPDEDELIDIIKSILEQNKTHSSASWSEEEIRYAAQALFGVSQMEAENAIANLLTFSKISRSDIENLRSVKDQLYSDISGLERITISAYDNEIGGLEHMQKWLDEMKPLFCDPLMRRVLNEKGLPAPRGVLLTGVPGCGKSRSARVIASKWNLPLYRLDFATVQGSYVGQSEHQLKDALTTAEQVSPCVLWIDEIEKGLAGYTSSGSDGGVSARLVGQFLFWLQECKKQVFVVATANDVSQLPAELLRRGRFDEIFFIDLPNDNERKSIISLYYRNYVGSEIDKTLLDKLVEASEGFTGADLEFVIREAGYYMVRNNGSKPSNEMILGIAKEIVPLSKTSEKKIASIREWGKRSAVQASESL